MLNWLRTYLNKPRPIDHRDPAWMLLNSAFDAAQGEIKILKEWNQSLEKQNQEFREIIYHRFGLHVKLDDNVQTGVSERSVPLIETWRTAKRKLEQVHAQPVELAKVQAHWEEKLRKQEEQEKESQQKEGTTDGN